MRGGREPAPPLRPGVGRSRRPGLRPRPARAEAARGASRWADISTALMHTSPSPCAPWASPTRRSAPSTQTAGRRVVPAVSCLMSMLPPFFRGGIVLCPPGSSSAVAQHPREGRDRHGHRGAERARMRAATPSPRVPDLQERVREVGLGQEAAAGPDVGPAERRRRPDIENLDHQGVAPAGHRAPRSGPSAGDPGRGRGPPCPGSSRPACSSRRRRPVSRGTACLRARPSRRGGMRVVPLVMHHVGRETVRGGHGRAVS